MCGLTRPRARVTAQGTQPRAARSLPLFFPLPASPHLHCPSSSSRRRDRLRLRSSSRPPSQPPWPSLLILVATGVFPDLFVFLPPAPLPLSSPPLPPVPSLPSFPFSLFLPSTARLSLFIFFFVSVEHRRRPSLRRSHCPRLHRIDASPLLSLPFSFVRSTVRLPPLRLSSSISASLSSAEHRWPPPSPSSPLCPLRHHCRPSTPSPSSPVMFTMASPASPLHPRFTIGSCSTLMSDAAVTSTASLFSIVASPRLVAACCRCQHRRRRRPPYRPRPPPRALFFCRVHRASQSQSLFSVCPPSASRPPSLLLPASIVVSCHRRRRRLPSLFSSSPQSSQVAAAKHRHRRCPLCRPREIPPPVSY